jgi:hypothetical protein
VVNGGKMAHASSWQKDEDMVTFAGTRAVTRDILPQIPRSLIYTSPPAPSPPRYSCAASV